MIDNNHYDPLVWKAWQDQDSIIMPFYACTTAEFKVFGLDYGYGVAELVCIEPESYRDARQSVSLDKLKSLLEGQHLEGARYMYVNRWYDEEGNPHHHGLYGKYPTIEEANRNVKFNMLDVPVNIVYVTDNEQDMWEYLHDVGPSQDESNDD